MIQFQCYKTYLVHNGMCIHAFVVQASRQLLAAAAKLHKEVTVVVIYDPIIQKSPPFG